jgi:hypothetical protein
MIQVLKHGDYQQARRGSQSRSAGCLAVAGCATPKPQAPREMVETNRPFAAEINAFADADHFDPPPTNAILFIGSSSIRLWKTLAEDFPQHQVINRGFGGSQIIDSVNYADRILIPYRPKHTVFYAGGNDINAGRSADQVLADFQASCARSARPCRG